jgi:hypothetical protein
MHKFPLQRSAFIEVINCNVKLLHCYHVCVCNVLVQNFMYPKSHTVSSVIAVKQEVKYKCCVEILLLCYIILSSQNFVCCRKPITTLTIQEVVTGTSVICTPVSEVSQTTCYFY